jgi:ribosomal protein S3
MTLVVALRAGEWGLKIRKSGELEGFELSSYSYYGERVRQSTESNYQVAAAVACIMLLLAKPKEGDAGQMAKLRLRRRVLYDTQIVQTRLGIEAVKLASCNHS